MRVPLPLAFAALVLSAACERAPLVEPASNPLSSAQSAAFAGPSYVFINGQIITMDPSRRIVTAIAVRGDRIVALGSNGQVARLIRANTRVINLEGRAVLPGIVDAHTHLFNDRSPSLDLSAAHRLALRHGITTLALLYIDAGRLAEMRAFHDSEGFVVRTSLYLVATDNCGNPQGDWWKAHPPTRIAGERLRIGGIKLFADGGTCGLPAVSQEFAEGSGLGDLFLSADDVAGYVVEAESMSHQVAIHAIGDRAIRAAQDGIAAALDGRPNVLRHRIDHNSLVSDDLAGRYGSLGIVPVLFGYYHPAILEPRDDPRRGECPLPERNAFYATYEANTRNVLDRNPQTPVAWHGDDPWIPPLSPMRELYNMVTRIGRFSLTHLMVCPPPAWMLDTRVSVMEGLAMMTINSAHAIHREREIGSLEAGKFADLIVMSANPLTVPPEQLWDTDVRMTMVGGEIVNCWPGFEAVCGLDPPPAP